MIKKCSVLLTGALSLFLLASCGSAVDKLNNTETSIYNALTESITTFNNPQSVKILECSEILHSSDEQTPYFVSSDSAHCYIKISAETASGGTANNTYCLLINSTDNYESGTMWTWDDVMDNLNSLGVDSKMMDVFFKSYAETSDYYVKSSDNVDVGKLNAALDEYMEEKGYK